MKRTQQLFEKIEEYLAETLSPEEKVAFEKEMAIDSELKTEVDDHRELHRILSDKNALDFKEKIQKIHKEIVAEEIEVAKEKSQLFMQPAFSYWKIAAAFIVLLGIGNLVWNNFRQTDKISDLYMAHYVPYPADDVTRGDTKNDLDIVMQQYANGEYRAVIGELEQLTALSKIEQLRLYLGNSYLNTGKEKEAIQQFENVSDTSKFYEDATWYRALGYLKLGEADRSIPILKEIISYNGLYKEKALELISKLEN